MATLDETELRSASEQFLDLLGFDLVLARKLLDDVFEPEEAGDLQLDMIVPDLISGVESALRGTRRELCSEFATRFFARAGISMAVGLGSSQAFDEFARLRSCDAAFGSGQRSFTELQAAFTRQRQSGAPLAAPGFDTGASGATPHEFRCRRGFSPGPTNGGLSAPVKSWAATRLLDKLTASFGDRRMHVRMILTEESDDETRIEICQLKVNAFERLFRMTESERFTAPSGLMNKIIT